MCYLFICNNLGCLAENKASETYVYVTKKQPKTHFCPHAIFLSYIDGKNNKKKPFLDKVFYCL